MFFFLLAPMAQSVQQLFHGTVCQACPDLDDILQAELEHACLLPVYSLKLHGKAVGDLEPEGRTNHFTGVKF